MILWIIFYYVGKTVYAVGILIIQGVASLVKSSLVRFAKYTKHKIDTATSKKHREVHIMMGAVSTHLLKMVADEKARIIK